MYKLEFFFLDFYPCFCMYTSIERGIKESSKYCACSHYPFGTHIQITTNSKIKFIPYHFFFFFKNSSGLNNTKFSSRLVGALLYIRRRGSKKLEANSSGKRENDERHWRISLGGSLLGTRQTSQELTKGSFLLCVSVCVYVWLCLIGFIGFKPWHQCREVKDSLVPSSCAIL